MQRIASRHNARLRDIARLIASSRERRKSHRCVLEGAHLIEVYAARVGAPETLVVVDAALRDAAVAALVERVPPMRVLVVSRALFEDVASMPAAVAVLAVVAPPSVRDSSSDFCLLLEDVQDPGNVGTMIRTAAAAGVDQVILSRRSAFAWSPKALRAGQGAHFLTTLIEDVDAHQWIRAFRADGGRIIASVVNDAPCAYDVDLRGRVAIAIGSEGQGLSPALVALADEQVTIPMAKGSESLNAAAAAAVLLFERVRQRRTQPRS